MLLSFLILRYFKKMQSPTPPSLVDYNNAAVTRLDHTCILSTIICVLIRVRQGICDLPNNFCQP